MRKQRPDYPAIEDYAAIGNLRTTALVSRFGSLDWCCMPQLDSPSVFAAILDHRRGGRFRVAPATGPQRGEQSYHHDTNVLDTWWESADGRLTVTDFMPLSGEVGRNGGAPPVIYRVLRCAGGEVEVEIEWCPRFDYARSFPSMQCGPASAVAIDGSAMVSLTGLPAAGEITESMDGGPALNVRLRLRDGDVVPLVLEYSNAGDGVPATRPDPTAWETALEATATMWRNWLHNRDAGEQCDFAGPWQELVDRSGLALKLLTYPRTGAIAAAATASLPEHIGGERNWDYRYTWIRDASFTAQALVALGHSDEAVEFLRWAEDVTRRDAASGGELHLMYTLDGVADIPERELTHLEGYRGSTPVRVGNKAAGQFQLDIYGELLDAAWEMVRLGVDIDEELWPFLSDVADQACANWNRPDYGIWEVRSEPRHFVYSKVMVWVALDRALRIAERFGLPADTERWTSTRDAVHSTVLERGYSEERGVFVQAFGDTALDAANLNIPLVGFLPVEDPRVQSTLDVYLDELTEDGLVYRYRTDATDDGLAGEEGAFGLTTFWMIDALALSGRIEEARTMFEGVARRANHVGLFAEQFDPRSGAFLGNFPQAFTHIGLINSAVYIAHAEGRTVPSPAPLGSREEREGRDA